MFWCFLGSLSCELNKGTNVSVRRQGNKTEIQLNKRLPLGGGGGGGVEAGMGSWGKGKAGAARCEQASRPGVDRRKT